MPIDTSRYPDDWPDIVRRITYGRACGRCECDGRCGVVHRGGRCSARNHSRIARPLESPGRWVLARSVQPSQRRFFARPVKVILCVAHLDDLDPMAATDDNLMAMCQHCHLLYDIAQHQVSRHG